MWRQLKNVVWDDFGHSDIVIVALVHVYFGVTKTKDGHQSVVLVSGGVGVVRCSLANPTSPLG